jgi:site-specific recombinase XerD
MRRSSYLNTNISVPLKYWDCKKQRVKPGYALSGATNALLDKKLLDVRQKLLGSALTGQVISPSSAKRLVTKKGCYSFFDLADEYVSDIRNSGKIGSADKVQSIFKKLEIFLGGKSATFFDIDYRRIKDYEHYLIKDLGNKANTIVTNLKTIKRIFSIAIERGLMSSEDNPFRLIKLKGEKTAKPFLTPDELKKIFHLDLCGSKHIERARSMFVWTILCGGMRVSDVLTLKRSEIVGEFLEKRIKKTNTPHRVKMPKEAMSILSKLLVRPFEDDGFVFDYLSDSLIGASPDVLDKAITSATVKYNNDLKQLGRLAGISKTMSSHIARISFITLAVASGIDLTTVRGIAGHSDIEMTAHYSKYIDNQGDAALAKLGQKFFEKK